MKDQDFQTLPVRRDYTPDELNEFADRSAEVVREIVEVQDEKKEAAADFKKREAGLQSELRVLAMMRREGYEVQMKPCRFRRDYETQMRQWIDEDTGGVVKEEPFTNEDRQRSMFSEGQD